MADLQPGDLIFYGNSYVLYHVVMYIGGGMVVQAEETGTNVMDTPDPARCLRRRQTLTAW